MKFQGKVRKQGLWLGQTTALRAKIRRVLAIFGINQWQ